MSFLSSFSSLNEQFKSLSLQIKQSTQDLFNLAQPSFTQHQRLLQKERSIDDLLNKRRSLSLKKHRTVKTLPPKHTETIRKIIANAESDESIITVGRCPIGYSELDRLKDGNWLNDQIIDGYMYLINERSKSSDSYLKVHAFNCYFYLKLIQDDFNALHNHTKRWKIDIFSKDLLLFPIPLGNHWTLGCVFMKEMKIKYYDSLSGKRREFFNKIQRFIEEEHKLHQRKEDILNLNEWQFEFAQNIPRQHNGYDCGVFLCIYAEHLSNRAEFEFGQEDMKFFRSRIEYELLTCKLLEE